MPMTHQFVVSGADGSTAGEVLHSNWNADHYSTWTNSTGAFPEILSRTGVAVVTSNSSAASTFFSYVLPARVMGTNRTLRYTLFAEDFTGTTAVVNNFRWQVTHNSSRWVGLSTNELIPNTTTRGTFLQVWIAALNSSATRKLWGKFIQSSVSLGTFGMGNLTSVGAADPRYNLPIGSSVTYTVTTGAASTFSVQFQWLNANSSLRMTAVYSVLELI